MPDTVLDEPGDGLLVIFNNVNTTGLAALLFTLDIGVLAAALAPVYATEALGALVILIGLILRATFLDPFRVYLYYNQRIS